MVVIIFMEGWWRRWTVIEFVGTVGRGWRRTLVGQRKTRFDSMGSIGSSRWSGGIYRTIDKRQIVHDGRRRCAHGVAVTRRSGGWGEFARVEQIGNDVAGGRGGGESVFLFLFVEGFRDGGVRPAVGRSGGIFIF